MASRHSAAAEIERAESDEEIERNVSGEELAALRRRARTRKVRVEEVAAADTDTDTESESEVNPNPHPQGVHRAVCEIEEISEPENELPLISAEEENGRVTCISQIIPVALKCTIL
ncbi:hypothetical protein VNO78_13694 [Psophocarpus tetragonolobus]|uniref:Uncharacterized protein n=1 Tax=Psophocarpus tetragonolobus TaxID=3891 RepID=A0AAN9SPD4_PSOTE